MRSEPDAADGGASAVRDRAVSDVLGFVLVFALVTATVGVVYTTGLAGLQDTRTDERVQNAERAFDVLGSSVDDTIQRNAPSRATEIRLADARLSHGDAVTLNVTYLGTGNAYDAELRPIVYAADGGRVVYEGGAVFREQENGVRMVREPPMTFRDDAVVPFVVTRASGRSAVGGSRTVLVRTVVAKRSVYAARTNGAGDVDVRLNVTSPRAPAWERYLEAEADASCSLVDDTAVCDVTADSITVPLYRLDVVFV